MFKSDSYGIIKHRRSINPLRKGWLTVEQAAFRVNRHEQTMYYHVGMGNIRAAYFGRRVLINERSLLRYYKLDEKTALR